MTDEQDITEPTEPGSQAPDDDAGPAVEPIEGDQGEYVEQTPRAASGGFDPDRPVATSPPPADLQRGVADVQENEGVEPDEGARGPQDPAQAPIHSEESQTDNADEDSEDEGA